jgi:hypothetical protein
MTRIADPVTVSFSRGLAADLTQLSSELSDRLHELLERNTDGNLTPTEAAELRGLVRITEFGQILSAAMQQPGRP